MLGMDSTSAHPLPGDPEPDGLSPELAPVVNPRAEPVDVAAPPRLLDRLREAIRVRHYSIRTEDTYVDWVRRFILFHGKRHPAELGPAEAAAFLTHLAVDRGVSPSTQNQAKSALLFLYRVVLELQLPWLDEVVAAKDQRRLPVVLTPSEVRALLLEMSGTTGLVASLLYGTGMRLLEALRLRVKDVGFERREILVRDGKGGKDRVTVLPENLVACPDRQVHHRRRRPSDPHGAVVGKSLEFVPVAVAPVQMQPGRERDVEIELRRGSLSIAFSRKLAPAVHDVGVDAVRHRHLGYRRAYGIALGQYLCLERLAVAPPCRRLLACHRVHLLLRGHDPYRRELPVQDGITGRIPWFALTTWCTPSQARTIRRSCSARRELARGP